MSQLVAGTGPGEMGDINEGWGGPAAPALPMMEDRVNQLMQQVAALQSENGQLQSDLTDLRQRGQQ